MEIKQIKCPNCGGKLKIKQDVKGLVTCDYCRTEFSVETTYSKSYDATKGAMDAQYDSFNENFGQSFNKQFKIMRFAPLMIFAIGIIIMVCIFIFSNKNSFNNTFEFDSGTKDAFFVPGIFDDVIKNNQTNRRKVELCFDEICTKDVSKLVQLKEKIDMYPKYEVVLEYKNGYVTTVNIIPKNDNKGEVE